MQWSGDLSVRRAVIAICIGAFFSDDSASGIHSYDTLGQTAEVLLRYTATHRIDERLEHTLLPEKITR